MERSWCATEGCKHSTATRCWDAPARPRRAFFHDSMTSTLSHLECTYCGQIYSADALHTLCEKCQRCLYPRYDLAAAARTLTRQALLSRREKSLWRWREMLPVREERHIL